MKKQISLDKNKTKKRKTHLIIYSYLILFLLIISVTATYTWFSLSKTPVVDNLSMYVTSHSGLELALTPDSEEWGSKVSYVDMASEHFPLRPITWSEKDEKFYAAKYGIDGRLSGDWLPLSEEVNANRDNSDGYFSIGTLYARSSQDVEVSLAKVVETAEGISGAGTYLTGTPEWDSEKLEHTNAGKGAENAIRIGIQITLLDSQNQPRENTKQFYIYEPNCDYHEDDKIGYLATPSIDGSGTLIPENRLILQKHSSWREASPVQNGVQIYTIGDFETPTKLFSLKADEKARIKFYIWLEGQDVDCTNAIQDARVLANIQFLSETSNGSGLKPIN